MDKATAMLGMSVELACGEAWRAGKKKRNGKTWWGPPAVVELHSEGIDSLNYLAELERQGGLPLDILSGLRDSALSLVQGARMAADILGVRPGAAVEPQPTNRATDKNIRHTEKAVVA